MKNGKNAIMATLQYGHAQVSLSWLIIAALVLFVLWGCNSSKTAAANTPQKSGQRNGPPSVEEVFKMDVNGDGKLSKNEVSGRLEQDFSRFDANNDGFITRSEYENAPRPQRRRGGGAPGM